MTEDFKLTLTTEELRLLTSKVIDHIEEINGSTITINEDEFWSVPLDRTFDFSFESEIQLTMGTLSDSLEFLRDSVKGDHVVTYAAVWLSELLKAVAHSTRG